MPQPPEPAPPSHADPLTRWASPAIGGPLGSRAGGHTRTWFQSTQIFLLAALGMFVIGVLVQAPCVNTGWAASVKYSHVCSSPLIDQFTALISPSVGGAVMTDGAAASAPSGAASTTDAPGTGGFLDDPTVAGSGGPGTPGNELMVRVLAELVPSGGLVARTRFFFALAMIVSAVGLAFTVLAVSRLLGHIRRWQLAAFGLSAVLPLAVTQSFDLVAIALALWGLCAWAGTPRPSVTVHRRAPLRAGILLGLAGLISPPALLLLAAVLLHSIPRWRKRAQDALTCLVAALVIVVAGYLLDVGFTGRNPVAAWLDAPVGPGSVWWLATLGGYVLHGPAIAWITIVAIAAILACMALAVKAAPGQWGIAHIALILTVLTFIVSPSLPIQYSLWLIPLACLGVPQWGLQLPWMFSEVFYAISLSLYLLGNVVEDKGAASWIVAVFLVIRLAMMLAIALTAFVKADDPPYRRFSSPEPASTSWFDSQAGGSQAGGSRP